MSDDTDVRHDAPTRRDTLKYGGAVAAGLGLAGCSDFAGQSGEGTPTGTGSYSVTMEPTGTMQFSGPPEEITIYITGYADIVASLGQFDRVLAMNGPENHFPSAYYDRLPGVDIDTESVTDFFPAGSNSADKEIFYEVDPDLNLIDPTVAKHYLGLDDSDITEITENVAPFFGSWMRRPQFSDAYPYYTLYEGTERIAQLFQETARYEALKSVHDELRAEIRRRTPPVEERPSYGYMNVNWWGDFDTAQVMRADAPGYQNKVFRDLELDPSNNAFADIIPDGEWSTRVDFEALLEADPEVILWRNGYNFLTGVDFGGEQLDWKNGIVGQLADDPLGGELRAVQSGRVLPGTATGSGPVTNLFNMEAVAKQLYPDEFGEYEPTRFPAEQSGEKLFDRQRVADIVNGDS
ncbi:ABC transporter substrate-binding protein [Haloarcula sp. S1CR25-12]|uniref:ABC transporter substrate-binding protein n=1 Tax=Haloarcula saliterrae TaxID=2950534 RepID=A0ABU2FG22_9EURY|nr:ABC transporter substrate-binding protein [Haloarcula sp. S1CR25-12]MDS0261210.1 ABC transporter substrate-binding protein [Haloarcula sp. S1CR25-12]